MPYEGSSHTMRFNQFIVTDDTCLRNIFTASARMHELLFWVPIDASSYYNTFTYDAAGNRATKVASGITTTYTYNYADQLTLAKPSNASGTTYTYDASGNMSEENTGGTLWTYYRQALRIDRPQPHRHVSGPSAILQHAAMRSRFREVAAMSPIVVTMVTTNSNARAGSWGG